MGQFRLNFDWRDILKLLKGKVKAVKFEGFRGIGCPARNGATLIANFCIQLVFSTHSGPLIFLGLKGLGGKKGNLKNSLGIPGNPELGLLVFIELSCFLNLSPLMGSMWAHSLGSFYGELEWETLAILLAWKKGQNFPWLYMHIAGNIDGNTYQP